MCEGCLTTWLSKCGSPTASLGELFREIVYFLICYKEKIVLNTLSMSQGLFVCNKVALQYFVTSGPRVKTGGVRTSSDALYGVLST